MDFPTLGRIVSSHQLLTHHVLWQNTVADTDVPDLVNKAVQWDSITRLVPGFPEEM